MASISINGITKNFGRVQAVKDINADIEDGEFVCIVGPSGCGKTTTLRIIAGLEEATNGRIKFGDSDVTNAPAGDRNVGMVFQNLALYPHMSVRNNMEFGLKTSGVEEGERSRRISDAAEMLDIEELLDRSPSELSGGQQQRVAIGRTTVLDPDVFLLDEPLASLDAKLRVEIREELQELHRQVGVTTVYVTHDQEQAMTMSDRILVMNDGEIQQFAPPEEIYSNPANEFVAHFIGTPSMNFFNCEIVKKEDQIYADVGFDMVPIDDVTSRRKISVNDSLRLGVRPEHINLSDDHTAGFGASVKFVEPTGKDKIVHLDIENHDLKAIVSGDTSIRSGEATYARIRPSQIHLFDPDTGKQLY